MTKEFRLLLSLLTLGSLSAGAHAVTLFTPETFSDGMIGGWGGGTALTNQLGGPGGAADRYLRSQSFGGSNAGSRMAFYNESADYTGNYAAAGATGVTVQFKNMTASSLSMRLVLMDAFGSEWTSTTANVIAANSNWATYSYAINSASMTRVSGSTAFTTSITSVTRMMFRHNPGSPSTQGTAIAAFLGADNIQVVPEPASMIGLGAALVGYWKRQRKSS